MAEDKGKEVTAMYKNEFSIVQRQLTAFVKVLIFLDTVIPSLRSSKAFRRRIIEFLV